MNDMKTHMTFKNKDSMDPNQKNHNIMNTGNGRKTIDRRTFSPQKGAKKVQMRYKDLSNDEDTFKSAYVKSTHAAYLA